MDKEFPSPKSIRALPSDLLGVILRASKTDYQEADGANAPCDKTRCSCDPASTENSGELEAQSKKSRERGAAQAPRRSVVSCEAHFDLLTQHKKGFWLEEMTTTATSRGDGGT